MQHNINNGEKLVSENWIAKMYLFRSAGEVGVMKIVYKKTGRVEWVSCKPFLRAEVFFWNSTGLRGEVGIKSFEPYGEQGYHRAVFSTREAAEAFSEMFELCKNKERLGSYQDTGIMGGWLLLKETELTRMMQIFIKNRKVGE